jgi:hypothetical protein
VTITRTAKQLCNEPDCKRIKLIKTGQAKSSYHFTDKEAIDCVIKSIDSHLNSMPAMQQKIFEKLRIEFEAKKSAFEINLIL